MRRGLSLFVVVTAGCFSPSVTPDSESDAGSSGTSSESATDGTSSDATSPPNPTGDTESTESATTTGSEPETDSAAESETGSETDSGCENDPCPAGALCTEEGGGFACDCSQGGEGPDCDVLPVCGNGVVERGEDCDDQEETLTCSGSCVSCDEPQPVALTDQELGACNEGAQSDCREGWGYFGNTAIQGFQVSTDGTLESIQLRLSTDDPSSLMHVALVDGGTSPSFPSGASQQDLVNAVLATTSASGLTTAAWVEFDFSAEDIELDVTHHYFIWQRMLPPLPTDPQDRSRWNLWASPEVPDPYPGGRSYYCPSGQPCDAQLQHWDFAFRVELTPAPPLCEAS